MKGISAIPLLTAIAVARPPSLSNAVVRDQHQPVQVFPTNVTGADKNAFPPVPGQLDSAQAAFLKKYQPLADKARSSVEPINENTFSAAGFCYSEYPCLSVNRAAAATMGDKKELTREQVSTILDQLTSSPQAAFGDVSGNVFSGLKITKQGAVLEVVAPPGSIPSDVLAGMTFDMFKLQSDNAATNSIRATQAKTDGKAAPVLALCLYPEGVDENQAYNFCIGNELDGSPTPNSNASSSPSSEHPPHAKRDNNPIHFVCGLVKIPIIC